MSTSNVASMPTAKTKSLAAKLAEVMAALNRIPKRGRNEFHHYDYATEADIVEAVRQELASRSIILVPEVVGHTREAVGEKGSVLTLLTMTFTFIDGESGEELRRAWMGAGSDKDDKGLYKGMTGAEKFFLMKFFLLPTGDDPEDDSSTDKRPNKQKSPKAPDTSAVVGGPTSPPSGALISAEQRTRLWTIAKASGWKKDEVKHFLLDGYGYTSSSLIPVAKYGEIVDTIQRGLVDELGGNEIG